MARPRPYPTKLSGTQKIQEELRKLAKNEKKICKAYDIETLASDEGWEFILWYLVRFAK